MKVLAVDIGGTNVKILATGQTESRKFPSGPTLTPRRMVARVKKLAGVERLVERLMSALLLDEAVIGGGNAKKLKEAPRGCRLGTNAYAFIGGFRIWEPVKARTSHSPERSRDDRARTAKGTHR